ncbi:MAG: DinB family protein [Planctomycetia bacterium]|nr:DinB family protein [Planctomycetia bacterium]
MSISISRPDESEYAADFGRYIRLVPDGDIVEILDGQLGETMTLLGPLTDAQSLALHPPHTWSIKQVVGHVTDCERVFGYRALRLARNDATPLASFDEMHFMRFADFNGWPIAELLEEFACVRRGHVHLFRHLAPDARVWRGTVNDHATTARAMAYAIAGHAKHHLDIVRRRIGGGQ